MVVKDKKEDAKTNWQPKISRSTFVFFSEVRKFSQITNIIITSIMFQPKFKFRPNTKGLILTKPVINLPTTFKQIEELPTFKNKLLAYYERFYKLRRFECNPTLYTTKDIPYNTPDLNYQDYVALLKRNFKNISYNTKREVILNLPPLTEEELEERLKNTLVFVFNHTVAKDNPQSDDPIYTIEDLEKTSIDNEETKIISTILRLDNEFPSEIKYDYKLKWFIELNKQLDSVDWEKGPTKKQIKYPLEYMGYKQYLITLMRLNESLKLCL